MPFLVVESDLNPQCQTIGHQLALVLEINRICSGKASRSILSYLAKWFVAQPEDCRKEE